MVEKEDQYRKALRLEYFTVGYNMFEAVISIVAGRMAGSISLVGFGMDSIAESLSGLVILGGFGNTAVLVRRKRRGLKKGRRGSSGLHLSF